MIEQIIARLEEELHDVSELGQEFWQELKQLHIAKAFNILRDLVEGVVVAVEDISSHMQGVTGKEKKAAVVKWLNSKIDIKWVPEIIEEQFISLTIDYLVAKFNNQVGKHGWYLGGVERGRKLFAYVKLSIQL